MAVCTETEFAINKLSINNCSNLNNYWKRSQENFPAQESKHFVTSCGSASPPCVCDRRNILHLDPGLFDLDCVREDFTEVYKFLLQKYPFITLRIFKQGWQDSHDLASSVHTTRGRSFDPRQLEFLSAGLMATEHCFYESCAVIPQTISSGSASELRQHTELVPRFHSANVSYCTADGSTQSVLSLSARSGALLWLSASAASSGGVFPSPSVSFPTSSGTISTSGATADVIVNIPATTEECETCIETETSAFVLSGSDASAIKSALILSDPYQIHTSVGYSTTSAIISSKSSLWDLAITSVDSKYDSFTLESVKFGGLSSFVASPTFVASEILMSRPIMSLDPNMKFPAARDEPKPVAPSSLDALTNLIDTKSNQKSLLKAVTCRKESDLVYPYDLLQYKSDVQEASTEKDTKPSTTDVRISVVNPSEVKKHRGVTERGRSTHFHRNDHIRQTCSKTVLRRRPHKKQSRQAYTDLFPNNTQKISSLRSSEDDGDDQNASVGHSIFTDFLKYPFCDSLSSTSAAPLIESGTCDIGNNLTLSAGVFFSQKEPPYLISGDVIQKSGQSPKESESRVSEGISKSAQQISGESFDKILSRRSDANKFLDKDVNGLCISKDRNINQPAHTYSDEYEERVGKLNMQFTSKYLDMYDAKCETGAMRTPDSEESISFSISLTSLDPSTSSHSRLPRPSVDLTSNEDARGIERVVASSLPLTSSGDETTHLTDASGERLLKKGVNSEDFTADQPVSIATDVETLLFTTTASVLQNGFTNTPRFCRSTDIVSLYSLNSSQLLRGTDKSDSTKFQQTYQDKSKPSSIDLGRNSSPDRLSSSPPFHYDISNVRRIRRKFEGVLTGKVLPDEVCSPPKRRRGNKGSSILLDHVRATSDRLLDRLLCSPRRLQRSGASLSRGSKVLAAKESLGRRGMAVLPRDLERHRVGGDQRLGSSVSEHDADLSLLLREGDAVSGRLRSMLTTTLLPSRGRESSVSPQRGRGGGYDPLLSPPRRPRLQLPIDGGAVPRTRSLGDVRPRRSTSTPMRGTLPSPQLSHHLSHILDTSPPSAPATPLEDTELYTLEDETRQLQREVSRLEALALAQRSATFARSPILEQADDWSEQQRRLQQLHARQATLISRLSNKIRQYRSRVRDSESRAQATARQRSDAEQRSELTAAALTAAQDKLRSATAQHRFHLQLVTDGLQAEKERCSKLSAELTEVQGASDSVTAAAELLRRERDEAQQQLQQLQLQLEAREQQWKREAQHYSRSSISTQQRALAVSRQAGSLRRDVSQLTALTQRDLNALADDISKYTGLIAAACASAAVQDAPMMASPADLWARVQECEKLQARTEAEKHTLQERIGDLNARLVELSGSLKDRERCILDLNRKLEEGVTEAEVQEGLREKVRTLEAYLLDIAQCVVRDADVRPEAGAKAAATATHASRLLRLPRDEGGVMATELPQSTVSAVRTALADRQLQIHEMQLKLTSHKDQLSSLRKQYEAADATAVALEGTVSELRDQLEGVAREREQTAREKDRVIEDLEALQAEKEALEKSKTALKSEVEQAIQECERKGRQLTEVEGERAAWLEERQHIIAKFSKERDDVTKHAHTIAVLTSELASAKQQMSLLSDSVGKLRASEERLEEGREDLMEQVHGLERHRIELETQLALAQRQEAELRHTVDKLEEYNISLSQDKTSALSKLSMLEAERAASATERAELRVELERLQDALAQLEEDRATAEAAAARATEKMGIVTIEKEKAELELNDVLSERHELQAHVSALERARGALEEELGSASTALQDRDRQLAGLRAEGEALSRSLGEAELKLSGREKDLALLRESLASVKAEKHSLENLSSALEKKWAANESKRAQLEKDNTQLKGDKERVQSQLNKLQRELEGELSRVREGKAAVERAMDDLSTQHKKQMAQQQEDYQAKLESVRAERLSYGLPAKPSWSAAEGDMQERLSGALQSLQAEREEGAAKREAEVGALKRQIDKLHRDRESIEHRHQEERHQAMVMAQQEVGALQEKVTGLQRDLSSYEGQLEQLRRSGSTKAEAGRASEAVLHQTIAKLKEDLHAANVAHEKQLRAEKDGLERRLRDQQARLEEQRREHDVLVTALRTDLRLAKEEVARLQQDVEEMEQRIKDVEGSRLLLQKEVSRLSEEARHADERRQAELQAAIKGSEHDKKDLHKKLQDREGRITGLEVNEAKNADLIGRLTAQLREQSAQRQEAQRHAGDTGRRVQALEAEAAAKAQEVEGLRMRVATEEDRSAGARQEAAKLKAKVGDYERERDGLLAEMALLERRLAELEDHHNARESHLQASLEDARSAERRVTEEKKSADNRINQLQQQMAEIKATESRERGRAEALLQQQATLEATRDALERRLHAVYAALRTLTHAYAVPTKKSEDTLSAELATALSDSLAGLEKGRLVGEGAVDPDAMRLELRTLMNQINNIECQRDEAQSRCAALEHEVSEGRETLQRTEDRLRDVTRTLAELEEKKRHIDDKLNKSMATMGHTEDALHRKESEIRSLTEEVSGLKRKLTDLDHDRLQLLERHQKAKGAQTRLESECGELRERCRALEQRCSLLDDSKQRLEADLNAARRQASEKHQELESTKSSNEAGNRSIRLLEDQNAALKSKIDELRARIAAAASSESDLKDKLSGMNRSLKETVAASSGLEEELTRSQSVLSRTDNDRRQLEERLAACQASLAEHKRQKEQAQEARQKAQQELSNAEIRNTELEMNLKALRGNLGERSSTAEEMISKIARIEHEKSELRSQLADVERRLAISDAEKRDYEKLDYRSDKERSDIKKILGKYSALSSSDAVDASVRDASIGSLRVENMELRHRLDALETEKTQLQQRHLTEVREASAEQRRRRQDDSERVRRLTAQVETLRQEKERCQLRIHALEQQIQQYRDQVREYRTRSTNVASDMRRVRLAMTDSLHNIASHPRVSAAALDSEIQNLSALGSVPSPGPGDSRSSRRYGSVSPRRRRGEPGSKKSLAFS